MTALHIFRSPPLTHRIRTHLLANNIIEPATLTAPNLDTLLHRTPLLSSCYAETLRLHLQAYVTRSSPHRDVVVGMSPRFSPYFLFSFLRLGGGLGWVVWMAWSYALAPTPTATRPHPPPTRSESQYG
jgi:hypothetical protein